MGDQTSQKSAKFRDSFLNPEGTITGVQPGDKFFFETKIFRSADLSHENFNLIVKSIVKSVTNDHVQVSDVEILGEFKDTAKQAIFKDIDKSKFQSQFRLKNIKLVKGENWGIVPSKDRSGLSQIKYQEDLYTALGLSNPDRQEETPTDAGDGSPATESALEILLHCNVTHGEAEILMKVLDLGQPDSSQIASATSIFNSYTEEEVEVDDTKYVHIGMLQMTAQLFGTSLTPNAEELHIKAQELSASDTESVATALGKISHHINAKDGHSIRLAIPDPIQLAAFYGKIESVVTTVKELAANKRASENITNTENIVRNNTSPSAPLAPENLTTGPQMDMQTIVSMLSKLQNTVDNVDNNSKDLNDKIDHTNKVIEENQKKTESRVKEVDNMLQAMSARMDRLENESEVTILNSSTAVNNSISSPMDNSKQSSSTTVLSKDLQEYISLSTESPTSVTKAQWLIDLALSNKLDLAKHSNLALINTIIPHRDTLIAAVVSFNKHSTSVEARKAWNSEFSKNAKSTSRATEKLHEFRSGLSMLMIDQTLNSDIRTAIQHLMDHMYQIYKTLDNLTTSNYDYVFERTGGTLNIPKRELKTMINSIPEFSGESDKAPWYQVEAALNKIPQVKSCNQADAISMFLQRLSGPARQSISDLDLKETATLQSVTRKLRTIFGNPVKTLRQIRANHIKTGHIDHASSAKRFQVVMEHKLLIDHTEACIASAADKSEAESILYIRDEVYQLTQLIPKAQLCVRSFEFIFFLSSHL